MPQVFRIGSYSIYFWIMEVIEARYKEIVDIWYRKFGKISYYC